MLSAYAKPLVASGGVRLPKLQFSVDLTISSIGQLLRERRRVEVLTLY
jgi:hypothetical protein